MTTWSVVLKLGGSVNPHQLSQVERYYRDLGTRLLVLQDVSHGGAGDLESWMHQREMSDLRVCKWRFSTFLREHPALVKEHKKLPIFRRQRDSFLGRQSFLSPHVFVSAPLVLLVRQLLDKCTWAVPDYTWVLEVDAIFTGSVTSFFDRFASDKSDLLSTNYIIADHTFWGTQLHWNQNIGDLQPAYTASRAAARIQTTDTPLPTWRCHVTGACDGRRSVRGWLFRSIMVERISRRLLQHTAAAIAHGTAMTAEVFETTLCLRETWCSLGDWARGSVRREANASAWHPFPSRGYRSEHYIFFPSKMGTVSRACLTTPNTWYHPVLELKCREGDERCRSRVTVKTC